MKEPFCWIMYYLYYLFLTLWGNKWRLTSSYFNGDVKLNQWFLVVCRYNCSPSGLTIHATELEHVTLDKWFGYNAYSLCFVCVNQCKLEQQACLTGKELKVRCAGLCPCTTTVAPATDVDSKHGICPQHTSKSCSLFLQSLLLKG